jgi:hypothetical protein
LLIEGLKSLVRDGLKVMVEVVEGTMNEVGDAVASDRKEREEIKKETGERLRKMEEMARNTEIKVNQDRKMRGRRGLGTRKGSWKLR